MNYYVSIALLWKGYSALEATVDKLAGRIPWTHHLVPLGARHCTLYAIAQLRGFDGSYSTPAEAMRSMLERLPRAGVEKILQVHLGHFRIRPSEFRIYENSSSIQFLVERGSVDLMRKDLSNLFAGFSLPPDNFTRVDFPIWDKHKNQGDRLFGSFARRLEPNDDNPLLHRESLCEIAPFEPESVQITVSDDALTNIREPNRDYFIVPLDQG